MSKVLGRREFARRILLGAMTLPLAAASSLLSQPKSFFLPFFKYAKIGCLLRGSLPSLQSLDAVIFCQIGRCTGEALRFSVVAPSFLLLW
ncbi:hypothetical protein ACHAWO_000129 [Cyclotella atomus]|uniref:Secreted protein n=1 Tax=Cyclotella atomus TaxID=382360 RepID=A0ABD3NZZ5_9STRA